MSSLPSASSRTRIADTLDVAPPSEPLDVSVIIVNYNVREFLEQALHSVERASEGLAVEVFVVDNDSVDGSAEMVRQAFPHVHVIVNNQNVGFSRANNQAIRQAKGRYLLILNPDTILQEDTLRVLVDHLDAHPDAGAVGCQILNPDGSFAPESRRAFPTPMVAFYRVAGLSRLFPRSRTFGRYNLTFLPRDEEAEIDALSGSCMLVRRDALHWSREEVARRSRAAAAAVAGTSDGRSISQNGSAASESGQGAGLLDESFFMYGEDLDWCYRIQEAGWKIFYTPRTRIIHYKGESTKKGELRYVRLFYGAMLLFIEKHFQNRYSRFFALVLRAGIMLRAGFTVLAKTVRRIRLPLLDFVLVFTSVVVIGLLRSWQAGASLHPSFLYTVAPAYGFSVLAGIASAGGYHRSRIFAVRPVLVGALVGLLTVAAASFFVKDIAFSRAVVGLAGALMIPVLLLHRSIARGAAPDRRRAIVVGSSSEAERLDRMLARHPAPPFAVDGYVGPERVGSGRGIERVRRLGSIHQLRDLVRLRKIDDVVFAAKGVPHADTFTIIHQLHDLPVQFRMLLEGRQHVIGKASIEDLSLPTLVEVDGLTQGGRSYVARRAFELGLCIPILFAYPVLYLAAAISGPHSLFREIRRRAQSLPDVIAGRKALVGYGDAGIPDDVPASGLAPGVFSVSEGWPFVRHDADTLRKAYLFYARHQSAALDCSIIARSLRNRR